MISDNGNFIAFVTVNDYDDDDDNNDADDVYVRDLSLGTTVLVSRVDGAGTGRPATRTSVQPSISADGTKSPSHSAATNLIGAGSDTNGETTSTSAP